MYASLTRNHTIGYFHKYGVIVTAKSDSPAGPYVMVDPLGGPYTLGPRNLSFFDGAFVQNPVVARLRNGSGYLLFYAGGNDPRIMWSMGPGSIGVAFTKTLEEPWQRPDKPVLEPLELPHWEAGGICNPAVYVREDNSILLSYRGVNGDGMAFASAPSWQGPYTRLYGGGRLFIDVGLEDPYLVGTKQGLHMIMHYPKADNCSYCWTNNTEALPTGTCTHTLPGCKVAGMVGAHAFARWSDGGSADPALDSWTLAPLSGELAGGYSLAVETDEAGSKTFSHREEPKLLWEWDENARDYVPTHLFNVVIDAQVPHWKFDESYIHAQPLAVHRRNPESGDPIEST